MCGPFTQAYTWRELYELYRLTCPPANIESRYNIAPTTVIDVVVPHEAGLDRVRVLERTAAGVDLIAVLGIWKAFHLVEQFELPFPRNQPHVVALNLCCKRFSAYVLLCAMSARYAPAGRSQGHGVKPASARSCT